MLRSSFRGIDPVTPGIFEGAERDARDGVEADAGEPFGGEEDAAEADSAGDAEDAGGGPLRPERAPGHHGRHSLPGQDDGPPRL